MADSAPRRGQVILDHDGYLPNFLTITEGRVHEVNPAPALTLPKGSVVVFDRGYSDYAWYNHLNHQGVYFVTRQRKLFLKWIKQNLKIKTFLGTSRNAVLTQIRVAMCMYLLIVCLKFLSKLGLGMQQILRLLQFNLFERRDLKALLRGDPTQPIISPLQARLQFA